MLAVLLASASLASPCTRPLCAVEWTAEHGAPHALSVLGEGRVLQLELGEEASAGTLRVRLDPERADIVQVRHRFLTSLTVQAEGPHVDLTDWLHHLSPWVEADSPERGAWVAPVRPGGALPFPAVTSDAIAAEVARTVADWGVDGAHWAEHARTCAGPDSYPCSVGVSEYQIEVVALRADEQVDRFVVALRVPMGC